MTRKEEIVQAANNYKAQFPDGYIKEYVYIDAAEWADRTMIDKVCEWLEYQLHNTHNGIKVNNKNPSVGVLLYNLRKAMKE